MHEYDTTLKSILTGLASSWHNVELPAVRHRRADLPGETADGRLVHIELQSKNRKFRRFPHQIVIYVGNAPLRMKSQLRGPELSFACRMVDIRELDAEALIESASLGENVIAVLARLGNEPGAVRRILARIAAARPAERGPALSDLMVLAGLRKLGNTIDREIEQMPILDDIMDHEVLARARAQARD